MKTKKMILGITIAIFAFAVVFIACKKNNDEAATGKQDPVATTNNVTAARSTGVQTYYSKDASSGLYYKMELTWDTDGKVTINRTATTSYPANVKTVWQFADNTPYTAFDHDTTKTGIDSIFISLVSGKKYFVVPFTPGDPVISDFPIGGGGAGIELTCSCAGSSGICKLDNPDTNPGNRWTCLLESCTACVLKGVNRYKSELVINETIYGSNMPISNSGCAFFEATAITIIN